MLGLRAAATLKALRSGSQSLILGTALIALQEPLRLLTNSICPGHAQIVFLNSESEMAPPSPKRILLHVGHGKTGSSYIQSSFALSNNNLSRLGVEYPIAQATLEKAAKGLVTSGNLPDPEGSFAALLETLPEELSSSLLLSSENMFTSLFGRGVLEEILAICPDSPISVLLFVRNPTENAASSYQQAVKRAMIHMEFSQYLRTFDRIAQVIEFIENCRRNDIEIAVFNYSKEKANLLVVVSTWLGVPIDALLKPRVSNVNRSLSRSELRLQLELNKALQTRGAGFLSTELVDRLPNVKSVQPQADRESLEQFRDRMGKEIKRANEVIGRHVYELEDIEPWVMGDTDDPMVFSANQLKVIVESFARRLKHLKD